MKKIYSIAFILLITCLLVFNVSALPTDKKDTKPSKYKVNCVKHFKKILYESKYNYMCKKVNKNFNLKKLKETGDY